jgi:hypothetical protein
MIDFFPVRYDEAAYSDYTALFTKCFPTSKKYSRNYLDWLYRCNPDGHVIGFDARDSDRLIAHYACIPARARVSGQEVRVLLSLNTATHPDYQGKGLFTELADRTFKVGAELNFDCVYGVANSNSTPGFIRKLKFQLIGPLQAMVGIGTLGIDFNCLDGLQFRRTWSSDALSWRCASPDRPVSVLTKYDRKIFLAQALFGKYCFATAEIDNLYAASDLVDTKGRFTSPLKLFIGMIPTVAKRHSLFFDIPRALRPSPLNLIYRSLSGRVDSIDTDHVFFNFLDFDAY